MTGHVASDTVGENIRAIRKRHGWSVAELAERCEQAGAHISASVIENIEHGRRRNGERTRDITVDELVVLAAALRVTPGVVLPALALRYENIDAEDHDLLLDTITGNLKVMQTYIERMRSAALTITPVFGGAALSGEGKLGAALTVTPTFGATLSGEGKLNPNPVIDEPAED